MQDNDGENTDPLPVVSLPEKDGPATLDYGKAPGKKPKPPPSIFARALFFLPAFFMARDASLHHMRDTQAVDNNQLSVSNVEKEVKYARSDKETAENYARQGGHTKAEQDFYTKTAHTYETMAQANITSAQGFANTAMKEADMAQTEGSDAAMLAVAGGAGFVATHRRKKNTAEEEPTPPAASR
jgi:hypothetical protein